MSEEPSAQNGEEVLLFEASGDRLALLASDVVEIIRPPRMTRVPHSPPNLLGVANLRGRVLPILSLSGLLGGKPVEISSSTRVIVVNGKRPLGVLVDKVMALARTTDGKRIDLDALVEENFRDQSRPARRAAASIVPEAVTAADGGGSGQKLVFLAFDVAGQEYALPLA